MATSGPPSVAAVRRRLYPPTDIAIRLFCFRSSVYRVVRTSRACTLGLGSDK